MLHWLRIRLTTPAEPIIDPRPELTVDAAGILRQAVREAWLLRHEYISTEHILLAFLRPRGSVVARGLRNRGVTRRRVLRELNRLDLLDGAGELSLGERLPMRPRAANVIQLAIGEARNAAVAPLHLFLALANEPEGIAHSILQRLGVTQTEARELVLAAHDSGRIDVGE